jgi:hypothetical protein
LFQQFFLDVLKKRRRQFLLPRWQNMALYMEGNSQSVAQRFSFTLSEQQLMAQAQLHC